MTTLRRWSRNAPPARKPPRAHDPRQGSQQTQPRQRRHTEYLLRTPSFSRLFLPFCSKTPKIPGIFAPRQKNSQNLSVQFVFPKNTGRTYTLQFQWFSAAPEKTSQNFLADYLTFVHIKHTLRVSIRSSRYQEERRPLGHFSGRGGRGIRRARGRDHSWSPRGLFCFPALSFQPSARRGCLLWLMADSFLAHSSIPPCSLAPRPSPLATLDFAR